MKTFRTAVSYDRGQAIGSRRFDQLRYLGLPAEEQTGVFFCHRAKADKRRIGQFDRAALADRVGAAEHRAQQFAEPRSSSSGA